VLLLVLLCGLTDALGATVLITSKPYARSHHLNGLRLARALHERGHRVGMVVSALDDTFMAKHAADMPYLHQLREPSDYTEEMVRSIFDQVEKKSNLEMLTMMVERLRTAEPCPYTDLMLSQCRDFQPDMLVIDGASPCPYIWAEKLGLPHISFLPVQPLQPILSIHHDVPMSPARWPCMGSGYNPYAPSFLGRLGNQMTTYMTVAAWQVFTVQSSFAKAGMPELSYSAAARRSRAVLILSDPLLDHPAPMPSNVKSIGALLPHEGGELEIELAALLERAGGRSVYMSFGTTGVGGLSARPFIDVWAQLPNVTVIWKVSNASDAAFSEAAKLPNVRLVEWVDQNAMLGHPDLGMFLTHGGHNSISEAAFHGVPILAVAIFGDQWESAARAKFHGFGESLDKRMLRSEVIKEHVVKVLENDGYKQAAARLSRGMKLFRKRRHPVDSAVDLIEDEIEAVKEDAASFPLPLPPLRWWQNSQVDVHVALALLLVLGGGALARLLLCCYDHCCRHCCGERRRRDETVAKIVTEENENPKTK